MDASDHGARGGVAAALWNGDTRPSSLSCLLARLAMGLSTEGVRTCPVSGQTLVEVLGTVVTIIGLVVVAPYEAGRLVAELSRALVRLGHKARASAARVLPFLRRDATVHGVAAHGSIKAGGSARVIARAGLRPDRNVEDRLNVLERAVTGIWAEVDDLRNDHREEVAELRRQIEAVSGEVAALRRTVDERYQNARELNARGFPLAAVGVVVANVPSLFLSWWWLLLFIPLCWVAVAPVRKTARDTWSEIVKGATRYRPQRAVGQSV